MIKYRFALDKRDNIVDIQNIEKEHLLKDDIFFSIDFKDEMIPRIGKKNIRHFAHKTIIKQNRTNETYLHALGKRVFYREYMNCLKNSLPFYLEYKVKQFCNKLYDKFNIFCEISERTEKFDLTTYFKEIVIEQQQDSYIPDLLLVNIEKEEFIYIEIAVTHSLSESKKQSGKRIIEFNLANDNEINKIENFKHGNSYELAELYNFKVKKEIGNFCGNQNCRNGFYHFMITLNGNCILKFIAENEIESSKESFKLKSYWSILEPARLSQEDIDDWNFYHDHEIESYLGRIYKYYLAKAYQSKVNLKNCFLCRYHARNKKNWTDNKRLSVFCKFTKVTCNSNNAVKCEYYRIENNYLNEYLKYK